MSKLISVVIVLVVVVGFYWWNPEPQKNGVVIGFDPPITDLGERTWKSEVNFPWKFVNNTDHLVTISGIGKDCGCTRMNAKKYMGSEIRPGEYIELDLNFAVGVVPGRSVKRLKITTDDGQEHEGKMTVTVVPTYTLTKRVMDFGQIPLNDDAEYSDSVIFEGESLFLVGEPQTNSAWLIAEYVEEERHDGDLRQTAVVVKIDKDRLSPGINVGTLRITTSDDNVSKQVLLVKAVGSQELRAIPSRMVLPVGSQNTVQFFDTEGETVDIVTVDSDDAVLAKVVEDGLLLTKQTEIASAVKISITDSQGRRGSVMVH
jgi:hypothetical protein